MSVYWITGLSGAGKSTLAKLLIKRLRDSGCSAVLLDGDELREILSKSAGNAGHHGRGSRLELAFQYARLGKLLAEQGFTVVVATISMFREIHQWNRDNLPGYFEIYLKVPLAELRNRDPKGIYRRFDAGQLSNVAGLDLAVDEPDAPDCVLEFDPALSINELLNQLTLRMLERNAL